MLFHVTVTSISRADPSAPAETQVLRSPASSRAQCVNNIRCIWHRTGRRIVSLSVVRIPDPINVKGA